MICNLCGVNESTIHLTEINNQQLIEIHLCEACAQEKGTDFKTHFNVNELIAGLTDPASWTSVGPKTTENCPECGMTYDDLSKKGRLGCSVCYKAFEKMLIPLIRRVQRSTLHVGKQPSRIPQEERPQSDLRLLQMRLRKCIENEAFEEAARLRDQIKKLEDLPVKKNKPGPKKGPK